MLMCCKTCFSQSTQGQGAETPSCPYSSKQPTAMEISFMPVHGWFKKYSNSMFWQKNSRSLSWFLQKVLSAVKTRTVLSWGPESTVMSRRPSAGVFHLPPQKASVQWPFGMICLASHSISSWMPPSPACSYSCGPEPSSHPLLDSWIPSLKLSRHVEVNSTFFAVRNKPTHNPKQLFLFISLN